MFKKILIITVGIIVAIPILLWFALRGIFTGSWKLLGFICQHQYRELKSLCESGTADELLAFLTAHPGAREYIVYTRRNRATSFITTLFKLPAPLAVAGGANNLAVIPVLLSNGASPEVRSVAAKQSPAEEAIGTPEKMRTLCGGKTWWLERTATTEALEAAINERNFRSIVWNVMRGAKLTSVELLKNSFFLGLPMVMKQFVCRFGIDDTQCKEFYSQLKALTPEEYKRITTSRAKSPFGFRKISLWRKISKMMQGLKESPHGSFTEMMQVLEESQQPLPPVDDDTMDRLMHSAGLMDKSQMLEMLDNLFSLVQQFAMLELFTTMPVSQEDRIMTEEVVDLLLCSLLKKAGDEVFTRKQ